MLTISHLEQGRTGGVREERIECYYGIMIISGTTTKVGFESRKESIHVGRLLY